jgi:hypothetical protein
MQRIVLSAVCIVALSATPAYAWNALGHKVVAEIAWRQLDPPTRQQIVDTLRRHPRFDTDFMAKMEDDVLRGDKAKQDQWIFQHAATWPDIARSLPAGERSKYDRPSWHYINFPLYLDQSDRRTLGNLKINLAVDYTLNEDKKNLNILQAIKYSRSSVGGKVGLETQALAYCWLMHLVGDIHQPLHSVSFYSTNQLPKGDRGGNEIDLVRGDDLHSVWDNLLGRQYYMRDVEKSLVELSDQKRFGDVWESAARVSDPLKWAQESRQLCEFFVYAPVILDAIRASPPGMKLAKIKLPESYFKAAGEHARRRIVAAGIRLGKVLQDTSQSRSRRSAK